MQCVSVKSGGIVMQIHERLFHKHEIEVYSNTGREEKYLSVMLALLQMKRFEW